MKAQRSDLYVGSDSSPTARVSVGGCFEPVYVYHMDELAKCTIVCCFLLLRRTTESLAWRCGEIGFEDELRTVQISARFVWQRPWNQNNSTGAGNFTVGHLPDNSRRPSHIHSCYSVLRLRSIMSPLSIRRLARVVKLTQLQ